MKKGKSKPKKKTMYILVCIFVMIYLSQMHSSGSNQFVVYNDANESSKPATKEYQTVDFLKFSTFVMKND